ncbi:MAG: hypothetical protein GVY12_01055 [Bacteroidetes bacterium]|jgi:predicted XRE-type DNA-binding protein|nr:hypothetical protein [Bacteroidota bacterium]
MPDTPNRFYAASDRRKPVDGVMLHAEQLGEAAAAVIEDRSTRQVAEEVGIPQPRVVEALKGRSNTNAVRILQHYAPGTSEVAFFYMPIMGADAYRLTPEDA